MFYAQKYYQSLTWEWQEWKLSKYRQSKRRISRWTKNSSSNIHDSVLLLLIPSTILDVIIDRTKHDWKSSVKWRRHIPFLNVFVPCHYPSHEIISCQVRSWILVTLKPNWRTRGITKLCYVKLSTADANYTPSMFR